jgi:hypothetical protein
MRPTRFGTLYESRVGSKDWRVTAGAPSSQLVIYQCVKSPSVVQLVVENSRLSERYAKDSCQSAYGLKRGIGQFQAGKLEARRDGTTCKRPCSETARALPMMRRHNGLGTLAFAKA